MTDNRVPDVQEDPRVARSTRALGQAMASLLVEREFADITVQQILDRAGVSRATFYKHFRNKDDVLFTSYQSMFAFLEDTMRTRPARTHRLAPVAEFLDHVQSSRDLLESLRASGKLDEVWELGVAFLADIIDRRLAELPQPTHQSALPRALVARMLSGALVEMVKWWLERPTELSAAQMDAEFHTMAARTLPSFGYGALGSPATVRAVSPPRATGVAT